MTTETINYGDGSTTQTDEAVETTEVSETLPLDPEEGETTEEEMAEPEETEGKSLDELPLPGEETKEKTLPKWVEKRLSKKDKEIQQRDAENAALRAQLQNPVQTPIEQKVAANLPGLEVPKREQYATDDDYIDARFAYNQKRQQHENQLRSQQASLVEAEKEFRTKWNTVTEKGSEKYDDFDEKTEVLNSPSFPANRAMAEAIVDSEHSRDILYFLGTYPSEAKKIALMNPVQAIKKIAELEQRFIASKKSKVPNKTPLIKPVGGSGGTVEGDPNNMSQTDFEAWYKRKIARKA